MDEETLLEEYSLVNIPEAWEEKFKVQNGNEQDFIKDVQKIICRIEKRELMNKKKTNKSRKGKGNQNGNGKQNGNRSGKGNGQGKGNKKLCIQF